MLSDGYTIEEVDTLTGPPDRPHQERHASAPRDLVGLDILVHASTTVYDRATMDEKRDYFKAPALMEKMLAGRMLGDKTGQGLLPEGARARAGSEIHTLDLATMEYRARQSAKFGSLESAKPIEELGERVRTLMAAKDRAGAFVWKLLAETFLYSAVATGRDLRTTW